MEFDTTQHITNRQYAEAWQAYQREEITLAEWEAIARKKWEQNMQDTIDVFHRLANR
jgi:mRNA-degrading endonuclease HigB of HigAB toxin-antitoxin module